MVFKYVIVCASAILLQSACGQSVGSGSTVTGNSVFDNDIYITGNGLSNRGLGSGAANTGFLNTAGFSSGIANTGSNFINAGSNLINAGLVGSGFNTGSLGFGLSTGSLGSNIITSGLNNFGSGYNMVASGPLAVTSISPIGPSGLAVASENVLEGVLTVSGQLPFLSAVAFEGDLPTSGSGVATCGCGNGDVAIVREGIPQGPIRY